MPSRSPDYPKTVALQVMPTLDDMLPSTVTPDTNAQTRCAPGGTSLPVLRPPTVPGDLGTCGGHRVLRVLGRGGMGVIYEAIDVALDRRVALKLMRPELADSEAGRERFIREAQSAAAIRHENVVNVHSVGADEGMPYLSMELLYGDHLAHYMLRGVPITDVVRIGREVALGLAAAHALGVIHRDIKPTNIWIEEPSGRVRLLDFGLARSGAGAERLLPDIGSAAPGLTEVGALLGTPAYMSPEQLDAGGTDARTDVFSLGAVLYQLITGRMAFRGATLGEVSESISAGAFQPVREHTPATPPALARLVERMLSPDPAKRPQTATAVADELLAIGTSLLLSDGVATPIPLSSPEVAFEFDDAPPPPPRRRAKSAAFALLGTVAAVCVMMLVVGGAKRAATRPPPAVVEAVPPPGAPLYVPLFNDRDLTGWHSVGPNAPGAWVVKNKILAGTRPMPADEVLLTDAAYANFELRMEFRWPRTGGHTVVLLRAADVKPFVSDCLAVNIGDDENFPEVHGRPIGGLYRTGLVQGVTSDPPPANKPIGQWNFLQITARGRTIEVKLNGAAMPTATLQPKMALDASKAGRLRPSGSIGLVCHWGMIDYRNVTIRTFAE